jgi:hypothetical protein
VPTSIMWLPAEAGQDTVRLGVPYVWFPFVNQKKTVARQPGNNHSHGTNDDASEIYISL